MSKPPGIVDMRSSNGNCLSSVKRSFLICIRYSLRFVFFCSNLFRILLIVVAKLKYAVAYFLSVLLRCLTCCFFERQVKMVGVFIAYIDGNFLYRHPGCKEKLFCFVKPAAYII